MKIRLLSLFCLFLLMAHCKNDSKKRKPTTTKAKPASEEANPSADEGDSEISIEGYLGNKHQKIEYQTCNKQKCQKPRFLQDQANEVVVTEQTEKIRARGCINDETCDSWQEIDMKRSSGEEQSTVGRDIGIAAGVIGGVAALGGGGAFIAFKVYKNKVKKEVKAYRNLGTTGLEKLKAGLDPKAPLPKPTTGQKPFLHVFDLDDTIMQKAFKHKNRASNPDLFLKPGMRETFTSIIKNNGHIAIATNNVREVEWFLMRELGFDVDSPSDLVEFSKHFSVLQPDIKHRPIFYTQPLNSLVEPWKNSKGNLITRAMQRFAPDYFAGIIFSDDKERFHRDVHRDLRAWLDANQRASIPIFSFEVGDRKAKLTAQSIRDSHLAMLKGEGGPIHSSRSIAFADFNKAVAESPELRQLLIDVELDVVKELNGKAPRAGFMLDNLQTEELTRILHNHKRFKNAMLQANQIEQGKIQADFAEYLKLEKNVFRKTIVNQEFAFKNMNPEQKGLLQSLEQQRVFSPADSKTNVDLLKKKFKIGAGLAGAAVLIGGSAALLIHAQQMGKEKDDSK